RRENRLRSFLQGAYRRNGFCSATQKQETSRNILTRISTRRPGPNVNGQVTAQSPQLWVLMPQGSCLCRMWGPNWMPRETQECRRRGCCDPAHRGRKRHYTQLSTISTNCPRGDKR